MKHYQFAILAVLFLLQACGDKTKPNIILVMTDDQGYAALGCHGDPYVKTPNIDQLYSEGVRLTDFHVSPTCSPTRGALLTGHYTARAGSWHTISSREMVFADELMLSEVLQQNGYSTGIFGKWHLGDNYPYRPQDRGFDETFVHLAGGVGQSPDYWLNDYFDDTYFHNGKPVKAKGYCTDVWFDKAMEYIGTKADANKPFFCYLSTNAPHGPYYVPDKYLAMYKNKEGLVNPAFYGMISNIDDNMGRLMQLLEQKGIAENTILIFTSDNGAGNGAGFVLDRKTKQVKRGYNAGMRGSKASMFEGGHRVPFIVRWPAKGIVGGRDVNDLTAHIDFFPTLVEALGLKGAEQVKFDGKSLLGVLTKKEQKLADRVIVTDNQRVIMPQKWKESATMKGKWRLINGKQLYHVKDDPGQKHNIANKHPEIVNELRAGYEAWWESVQGNFDEMQAISLCHDSEPTTVISAMDLIPDQKMRIIWKQEHLRDEIEKFEGTGWYSIQVPQAGKYRFSLLRYPPEANLPIHAAAKAVAPTPGINIVPYKEAVVLDIEKASIQIDNQQKLLEPVDGTKVAKTFELDLKGGVHKLRAHFQLKTGQTYPAMFIKVERLF